MGYHRFNILDLLEESGEQGVQGLLSCFSCPQNADVEKFLRENAIDFARQGKSVSYLIFSDDYTLLGYYTIAIKPITVKRAAISRSMAKRIARVSNETAEAETFTLSAYLIAQLGKNYAAPKESRISGRTLLEMAEETILQLRHMAGGVIQFLEREESDFLKKFYTECGYTEFDTRFSEFDAGTSHTLHQMLRKI